MNANISADESGRIRVAGPVTFSTAAALLHAGRPLLANKPDVTIDLGETTAVDSAGLALLLEWLRQARLAKQKLRFVALPEKLLAIARLSGVEGLLTAGD
ncbi:MAG: STAS domain-containing protein [Gammaproteobacteria bacterium]